MILSIGLASADGYFSDEEVEDVVSQARGLDMNEPMITVLRTLAASVQKELAMKAVLQNKNEELADKNEEITQQKEIIFNQKEELKDKHNHIENSVIYAKYIQNAMLPSQEQMNQLLPNHFVINKPKDIVSGDFYWIKEKDKQVIVAVADCTGHWVPGAFMSVLGHDGLEEYISGINTGDDLYEIIQELRTEKTQNNVSSHKDRLKEIKILLSAIDIIKKRKKIATWASKQISPADILNKLRTHIKTRLKQEEPGATSKDGMDMSLIVLQKWEDWTFEKVRFAGAYNPMYIVRGEKIIDFKATRSPIGIHIVEHPFDNQEFGLQPGDTLYMFSDGYTDQFDWKNKKKFGKKELKKLLINIQDKNMHEQKEVLENKFNSRKWKNIQFDDVLLMGIRI